MKYTGDEESLVQEYTDGKLLYRFVVISEYLKKLEVKINLDGKDKIIPVEFDELLPEKSGDIRYEEKDGVLTVVIKTMRPRHDDNITEYLHSFQAVIHQTQPELYYLFHPD